jgi:hypothetical protein
LVSLCHSPHTRCTQRWLPSVACLNAPHAMGHSAHATRQRLTTASTQLSPACSEQQHM